MRAGRQQMIERHGTDTIAESQRAAREYIANVDRMNHDQVRL